MQHTLLFISLTLLRSVPYLRLSSSRVSLWSSCEDTQRKGGDVSPVFMFAFTVRMCVFNMPRASDIYNTLCADLSFLNDCLSEAEQRQWPRDIHRWEKGMNGWGANKRHQGGKKKVRKKRKGRRNEWEKSRRKMAGKGWSEKRGVCMEDNVFKETSLKITPYNKTLN